MLKRSTRIALRATHWNGLEIPFYRFQRKSLTPLRSHTTGSCIGRKVETSRSRRIESGRFPSFPRSTQSGFAANLLETDNGIGFFPVIRETRSQQFLKRGLLFIGADPVDVLLPDFAGQLLLLYRAQLANLGNLFQYHGLLFFKFGGFAGNSKATTSLEKGLSKPSD